MAWSRHSRASADNAAGVCIDIAGQIQAHGQRGWKDGESLAVGLPKVMAATEDAEAQNMKSFLHGCRVEVGICPLSFDGPDQQAVCGIDVTVAVDENESRRRRGVERTGSIKGGWPAAFDKQAGSIGR